MSRAIGKHISYVSEDNLAIVQAIADSPYVCVKQDLTYISIGTFFR